MKNIITFCILYFITMSVLADTCPLPPKGFIFRVAAWGDHQRTFDTVRCHYYTLSDSRHIEVWTGGQVDASAFRHHPEWSVNDRYALCTSHNTDVRECPFN